MMQKTISRAPVLLLLGLVAYWAGLAGYWTAQREPPVRVERLDLITPQVPAGGVLHVRHTTSRHEACGLTVERTIIDADGVLFRMEDLYFYAGRVPVGGADSFIQTTPVPMAARPGRARLRETLVHVCNPVHRLWPVTQRMPDLAFIVLPPE